MTLNYDAIGRRIKAARKRSGLTQLALSEAIDRSVSYLSYIENGQKSLSLTTLVRIANALDITADELLMDNLENTITISSHAFASVLADCSDYEKRVLLDTVTAVKCSLQNNRIHFRPSSPF